MTFRTRVFECVAGKTTSEVHHRQLRVTTRFELWERQMAAGRLVVAAAAKISQVAHRAVLSIERRVFPVNVVLPARRVCHGHHDLMTTHALLLANRCGRDVQVTNKTRGARRGGFQAVVEAKTLCVRRRLNNARNELPARGPIARRCGTTGSWTCDSRPGCSSIGHGSSRSRPWSAASGWKGWCSQEPRSGRSCSRDDMPLVP